MVLPSCRVLTGTEHGLHWLLTRSSAPFSRRRSSFLWSLDSAKCSDSNTVELKFFASCSSVRNPTQPPTLSHIAPSFASEERSAGAGSSSRWRCSQR